MLSLHSWPRAILHLDGNAFFASVMQAAHPKLQHQPVVVGQERGIATAISYEAKAFGITRGMLMKEIRERCPKVIILSGDYELFSLYSQRMFAILRQYSPVVEEYSVDEGFAEITGLRRPLHLTYQQIATKVQAQIKEELNLPISVGISLSKSLAKLASGFRKPMGITVVPGRQIEAFLKEVALEKVWGIGPATSSYLHKFNIKTALDYVRLPESVFNEKQALRLNKSQWEIWSELQGNPVYEINPQAKNEYKSIGKTRTFHPETNDPNVLWAELLNNIEQAFGKARRYGYLVKKMGIFLKTSHFRFRFSEIKFLEQTEFPMLCRDNLKQAFQQIFSPKEKYRATGCNLLELSQLKNEQINLFAPAQTLPKTKVKALYQMLGANRKIDFGASLYLKKQQTTASVRSQPNLPHLNIPLIEI